MEAASLFAVPNLVAVITGGGTGIGLMAARALAANGASKVYILGRRLEKLEEAASSCPTKNIIPLQCDVTLKPALESAVARIKSETGYVNLLACNSGTGGPLLSKLPENASVEQAQAMLWGVDQDAFTGTFALNNTAVYFSAVAFMGLLDEGNKRKGENDVDSQIVVTSSIAAHIRHVATGFSYVASKAGATHMAKAMSTYFAPFRIRVNVLAPGMFESEMTEEVFKTPMFSTDSVPSKRVGKPEEMGGTFLYMASKAGGYLNGNVVVIDGGRLSTAPSSY